MRKGKIDSYKDEMPKVYIQRMNEEMIKWKEVNDIYPGNWWKFVIQSSY